MSVPGQLQTVSVAGDKKTGASNFRVLQHNPSVSGPSAWAPKPAASCQDLPLTPFSRAAAKRVFWTSVLFS